jgi:hypothetical protein
MSEIKLAGRLPKGDANGLGVAAPGLIRRPDRFRVAIVVIDCETITTHADTGEVVPTARVRRAEIVVDEDLEAARRMVMRSLERRTNHDAGALPLNFEHELGEVAEAFVGNGFVDGVR